MSKEERNRRYYQKRCREVVDQEDRLKTLSAENNDLRTRLKTLTAKIKVLETRLKTLSAENNDLELRLKTPVPPQDNINISTPCSSLRDDSESDANASSSIGPRAIAGEMIAAWKEELSDTGLPIAERLTDKRVRAANARYCDTFHRNLDEWRAYLVKIRNLPFLLGDSERGWKADFEWALKVDSIAGVVEGKYERANGAMNGHGRQPIQPVTDLWRGTYAAIEELENEAARRGHH